MNKYRSYFINAFFFLFSCMQLRGQPLFFRNLGEAEGINSGNISHAIIDKNGLIWIATLDGLFLFDGYGVQQFSRETNPGLPDNDINYLYCDSRNRIWMQTGAGVMMIDEDRRLQTINIPGNKDPGVIDRRVFEVNKIGMIAINADGAYISTNGFSGWQPYSWLNSILKNDRTVSVTDWDDESKLISVRNKRILLVNFKQQKLLLNFEFPGALGICRINNDEILAGTDRSWRVVRISVSRKKIIKEYLPPKDKSGKSLLSATTLMHKASDGNIYIGTRSNGLLRFHPASERFDYFQREPLNENSIRSNSPTWVSCDDKGMLVTTARDGVSYSNVNYPVLNQQNYFKDGRGNIIHEPVTGIVTASDSIVYLTTAKKLIRWNRVSGQSFVLRDMANEENNDLYNSMPGTVVIDDDQHLWAGFNGDGIIVYNKSGQPIRHLKNELPSSAVRELRLLDKDRVIVGCENGLFIINRKNYAVDSMLEDHPALGALLKKRVVDMVSRGDELWLAISPRGGLYHYNWSTKRLETYTTENGLISNRVYCVAIDKLGNTYAGTREGLSIIDSSGGIRNIDKSSGLLNIRVDNLLADDEGNIWFTNSNKICRYNPYNRQFSYFDEHNGISNAAFVTGSSHKSANSEIFFGTSSGLIHFEPGKIKPYRDSLRLYIHRTVDGKNFIRCYEDSLLHFKYNEGKIIFQVSASDILGNQQIYYRYKLEGLDTGWSVPTHIRSISYNLSPGQYKLKVQASYDLINFIPSEDTISLEVQKAFWQTTGFLIAIFGFVALLLWLAYQNRIKAITRKSQFQQQVAELEAKALRAQMNPHFIFNALNAIQELVITEETDKAYEYLLKFSRLLRLVLNNSEKNTISLGSELEMIQLYLSLESLRFRQSFSYTIDVDKTIDMEETEIPGLIVQPYIENALWHGLRTKEGAKTLALRFFLKDDALYIEVEDNGIGREAAERIKKNKLGSDQFESKGTLLSAQRIGVFSTRMAKKATVKTIDLLNDRGEAIGTRVVMEFPQLPGN
ncbi:sensor histidine kinase [Flavihumibacter sp.]|uniref:sensor histidine kinase n=1 Tax=Flavihumibacter sp. TaxID=1913981 RepID=UPI002FC8DEBB